LVVVFCTNSKVVSFMRLVLWHCGTVLIPSFNNPLPLVCAFAFLRFSSVVVGDSSICFNVGEGSYSSLVFEWILTHLLLYIL
jgi:hypothetical protein